jgi:ABC-type Na+ efflux pump permease subunit
MKGLLRVARWEVERGAGALDTRALVALLVVGLALGAAAPALAANAGTPDRGVYPVAIGSESPYYEPVERADPLRPVEPGSGAVLEVSGTEVRAPDTPVGRAAAGALRTAVRSYNDRLMEREPDRAAAFPVSVELRYVELDAGPTQGSAPAGGSAGTDAGDAGADDGGETESGTGGGAGSEGSAASGSESGGSALSAAGSSLLGANQRGTPGEIRPPFPLRSLVLAFLFLLPLNVAIQAYGASVLNERIHRRGEALLVTPLSRGEIVAGKTLPYLLACLGVAAVVAVAVGAGALSVLAVGALAGLFLGSTFLAALFARSFKELTFLTTTISVSLTAYAFVPAVFTDVHPIAAVSPLTVVVTELTGSAVDAGTLLVSTVPTGFAALVCFGLGAGIYREEDLFTQRAPPAKALDALAARLSLRRCFAWGALSIPFVLLAELFAVAFLFVLPLSVSVPLLLLALAAIEELAKSVFLFAGFERGRLSRDRGTALRAGLLSGLGFAFAEKLLLLTRLVGLPALELGRLTVESAAPAGAGGPSALLLLLAPFALHAVTAATSALGAARSRRAYLLALALAVLIHVGYNAAVVGLA